jgi:hypothetical protein
MVLVRKPEGKRPLGRPRHRWEANIKMDLEEVGWGAWTGLMRLKIGTGSCECGNEPAGSKKMRGICLLPEELSAS